MALPVFIQSIIGSLASRGDPVSKALYYMLNANLQITTTSDGLSTSHNVVSVNKGDGLGFDTSSPKKLKVVAEKGVEITSGAKVGLAGYVSGSTSTTDGTTATTILTMAMGGSATGKSLRLMIKGYLADGTKCSVYELVAALKTDGATAAVAGTNVVAVESDLDGTITVAASGGNILVKVTGVGGKTITWECEGILF